MGTPEFAVATLRALVENEYNVVAVVTQPDKPVGRHQNELQPSEVKKFALEHQLPVLQPVKMKDPEFVEQLRSFEANLQVVVAFRMLPEVVWAMPEYGTFNVHAALLPEYRGAAPINWAIINGETFDIPFDADVEYVYDGLMQLGADICLETLEKVVSSDGHPDSIPQEQLITAGCELHAAPKIFKETCEICWNQPAERVYHFVRGLSPVPAAWTTLCDANGRQTILKIYKTALTEKTTQAAPGTIVVDNRCLYIAAQGGELLQVLELQLAGKKRMSARDFLNGNKNFESYIIK